MSNVKHSPCHSAPCATSELVDKKATIFCLFPLGGGGTYLCSLAIGLSNRGMRVRAVLPSGFPELQAKMEASNVICKARQDFKTTEFIPALEVISEELADRSDITHSIGYRTALSVCIASKFSYAPRTQMVFSSINFALQQCSNEQQRKNRTDGYRYISENVDAVIVNSDLEAISTILGQSKNKLHHIPNGLPSQRAFRSASEVNFDLNATTVTEILFVGRFEEQKGLKYLLQAINEPILQQANIRLTIVGNGSEKTKATKLLNSLSVNKIVQMHPWDYDLEKWLSSADIVVIPSLWEGLPYVLLEAMAAGKPIIATKVNGIADAISDEWSGLLSRPGDALSLATAIRKFLDDPELARKCGVNARATFIYKYTEERMLASVVSLYASLLVSREAS
jgi:glycosyltransferase involved in cell wall biosynthesis